MLKGLSDPERAATAQKIFDRLIDLPKNKGHDKHFHYDECLDIGLDVELLEGKDKKLQDLVLTVHHCYMHTLANTGALKLIENHVGRCYAKIIQQIAVQQIPGQPAPAS